MFFHKQEKGGYLTVKKSLKVISLVLALITISLFLSGCGSSSSSSSGTYRYGTRESYDAKYGPGAYDADKALLDEMRDAWNSGH